MKTLFQSTHRLFEEWGKQGGLRRGKILSPGRRHLIASLAARSRWGKDSASKAMPSIRLENPSWDDPVYLEEILADGGLPEWRELYRLAADHPFGETAQALEKVLNGPPIYGATPLWKAILKNLQGGGP